MSSRSESLLDELQRRVAAIISQLPGMREDAQLRSRAGQLFGFTRLATSTPWRSPADDAVIEDQLEQALAICSEVEKLVETRRAESMARKGAP